MVDRELGGLVVQEHGRRLNATSWRPSRETMNFASPIQAF
jgi:hypothetical protein